MENEIKEPKTYLNYGVLAGVVWFVLFIVFYVFGLDTINVLLYLIWVVYICLIIVSQVKHAKSLNGDITYGNLFAAGFKAACSATAIYLILLFVFLSAFPQYKEHVIEMSTQKMIQKGLNQNQIEMRMSAFSQHFKVITIGSYLFFMLLVGVIASLIGAAVARKNPQAQNSLS